MAIKDYYQKLSPSEKTDFTYQVCKLCGISIPTFQKKIFSRGFRPAEEIVIAEKIIKSSSNDKES